MVKWVFTFYDKTFTQPTLVDCRSSFCLFTKSSITKDGGEEYLEQAENMVISAINPPPLAICTLCAAGEGVGPCSSSRGDPAAGAEGQRSPPIRRLAGCSIVRPALGLVPIADGGSVPPPPPHLPLHGTRDESRDQRLKLVTMQREWVLVIFSSCSLCPPTALHSQQKKNKFHRVSLENSYKKTCVVFLWYWEGVKQKLEMFVFGQKLGLKDFQCHTYHDRHDYECDFLSLHVKFNPQIF